MQVNNTCVLSLPCSQTVAPYLRVKYDVTYGLELAGANDRELGTTQRRHLVTGLGSASRAAVVANNAFGTVRMIADGVIAAWAVVYGGASGKVSATANGNPIGFNVGPATTADGDQIEILRFPQAGPALKVPEAHTADDTLTAAESGSVHTTVGATGTVVFTVPAATVGLEYFFKVGAAQELRIDPNGTETIALPSTGVQGAAGKYLTANAAGETVHLLCDTAGEWSCYGYTGTWTAEG